MTLTLLFNLVNHRGILYKLKSMGVGGLVFNIFKDILTNRQQLVSVDGNFCQFKPVISVFWARYSLYYIHLIYGMTLKIKIFHMQVTKLCMLKLHLPLNVQMLLIL